MRRLARLGAATDGITTIEFAFIGPVIVILIVGLVDFGMALWYQMQVGNAARAGAAYAEIKGWNATTAQIQNAASNATKLGVQITSPASGSTPWCGCPTSSGVTSVSCGTTSCSGVSGSDSSSPGHYWTVTATYTDTFALPWFGPSGSKTLSLTATNYARLYP